MKKFALLAVMALIAAPAIGADSTVTITVEAYCEVVVPPGNLVMTAGEPGGSASVSTEFRVQGNAGFDLTIMANETTASVEVVAGQLGGLGFPYPTARIGGPGGAGSAIGYGIQISGDLAGAWGDGSGTGAAGLDVVGIVMNATAGLKVCTLRHRARIT